MQLPRSTRLFTFCVLTFGASAGGLRPRSRVSLSLLRRKIQRARLGKAPQLRVLSRRFPDIHLCRRLPFPPSLVRIYSGLEMKGFGQGWM